MCCWFCCNSLFDLLLPFPFSGLSCAFAVSLFYQSLKNPAGEQSKCLLSKNKADECQHCIWRFCVKGSENACSCRVDVHMHRVRWIILVRLLVPGFTVTGYVTHRRKEIEWDLRLYCAWFVNSKVPEGYYVNCSGRMYMYHI